MKRFILFVILAVILDQSLGYFLNILYAKTTTGETTGMINYALNQSPDVMVLGSSRARHHVSPAILSQRLSATVFNAGANGQDFLYAVMLMSLWCPTHAPPKVILLHIDKSSLSHREEEIQKTSVFSAFYTKSAEVKSILRLRSRFERLKYLSYCYRFNGKVFPILKNLVSHSNNSFDGYVGLEGALDPNTTPVVKIPMPSQADFSQCWDIKLRHLENLARYCKTNGCRLVLFHSPYFDDSPADMAYLMELFTHINLGDQRVEYLDLSDQTLQLFAGRAELFKDRYHLNVRGSELFSRVLADHLAAVPHAPVTN